MGLLDSDHEEPKSKLRRWIVTGVAFVLLVSWTTWRLVRFYPEKRAAENFFSVLAAGDLPRAYQLWKPSASYAYKDFLEDWGPAGYYGPVKSFHFESAQEPPRGGSGVIVVVEVSPLAPFPAPNDVVGNRRTKEVRLWVESKDKSLSFPP